MAHWYSSYVQRRKELGINSCLESHRDAVRQHTTHMVTCRLRGKRCHCAVGLTAMYNVQDHPRSRHGTLVSLVCSRFGQFGSTKTPCGAHLVVKWLIRNTKFLELKSFPAGHTKLVICRDVHCGYKLWWIALLRMSITNRSQRTLWWSCAWENLHSECKQLMQAAQTHRSSAHMQEGNSKVFQYVFYEVLVPVLYHSTWCISQEHVAFMCNPNNAKYFVLKYCTSLCF